jgi:predicted phage gp36 major capsid-like protein
MPPDDTHVALKEFIEKILEGHEKLNEARFQAVERAVEVANGQMEKRLEGMNEFRDSLKDQASRFFTRDEFHSAHGPVLKDIEALKLARATLEGKASQKSVNVAYAIAVIGIVISLIGLAIHLTR